MGTLVWIPRNQVTIRIYLIYQTNNSKIQPRVVKQIIDSKTGEKKDLEIKKGERVAL